MLDPDLARRIPRLVLMCGSHRLGNVTPSAEFNIWADPEAARIVLCSGIRERVVVPLDATHQALVSGEDCGWLAALGRPAGTAAAGIIGTRIAGYEQVAPQAVSRSAPTRRALHRLPGRRERDRAHIDVELVGEPTRGRTVVDLRPIPGQPANASRAFGTDRVRFLEILLDSFASSAVDAARKAGRAWPGRVRW